MRCVTNPLRGGTLKLAFLLLAALPACTPADAPARAAAPESRAVARAQAESTRTGNTARPSAPSHTDPQLFWRDFRDATLTDDTARLVALTRFPFRVSGELDGDPATGHGRDAFPALYSRLLREHRWLTLSDSLTMRELIRRTPRLDAGNFNGEERHFHVGALYFGVDEGRWRLLEAALADP